MGWVYRGGVSETDANAELLKMGQLWAPHLQVGFETYGRIMMHETLLSVSTYHVKDRRRVKGVSSVGVSILLLLAVAPKQDRIRSKHFFYGSVQEASSHGSWDTGSTPEQDHLSRGRKEGANTF